MIVFMLYHIRELEDGEESAKLIGVYTTEERAQGAIKRVIGQPGFRDYPDGFQVFPRILDKDSWVEGFISTDEALAPYT